MTLSGAVVSLGPVDSHAALVVIPEPGLPQSCAVAGKARYPESGTGKAQAGGARFCFAALRVGSLTFLTKPEAWRKVASGMTGKRVN